MHTASDPVRTIHGQLVVSCQAWPGDPLDDLDALRRMALAAVRGGAGALRLHGTELIALLRPEITLPIIGIEKQVRNGEMRITPDFDSAARLARAGADIIALDCTERPWSWGEPWRDLLDRIHSELKLPVMADVSTLREGLAAGEAGADLIGTTLCGYTAETRHLRPFCWELLEQLVSNTHLPVIAEGGIGTPGQAARALRLGAWSVVVGSAITRPSEITEKYARAIANIRPGLPALGVDIGGTTIKAALVATDGSVSHAVRLPTPLTGGAPGIAGAAAEAVDAVLAQLSSGEPQPRGIGIASAGCIGSDGSVFAATDNLPGWSGFPLAGYFERRYQLPVKAHNDAHAAALAEQHFGAARGLADFVALTLGTGVGGGVVSGGKLLLGKHGFAGTLGHMVIRAGGRPCNCGRSGCLEAYVSASALVQHYAEHAGLSVSDLTATDVAERAACGDPAAIDAYQALAEALAEGVANLFNILDPQAVILSGGLIEEQQWLADTISTRVRALLHFGRQRNPDIRFSTQSVYAGTIGAASALF